MTSTGHPNVIYMAYTCNLHGIYMIYIYMTSIFCSHVIHMSPYVVPMASTYYCQVVNISTKCSSNFPDIDIPCLSEHLDLLRVKLPTVGAIESSVVQPAHLEPGLRVGKVELLVQVVGVGDEAASLLQHISGRAAVTSKLIAQMVDL